MPPLHGCFTLLTPTLALLHLSKASWIFFFFFCSSFYLFLHFPHPTFHHFATSYDDMMMRILARRQPHRQHLSLASGSLQDIKHWLSRCAKQDTYYWRQQDVLPAAAAAAAATRGGGVTWEAVLPFCGFLPTNLWVSRIIVGAFVGEAILSLFVGKIYGCSLYVWVVLELLC
nr:MAG: hypothetical protein [Sesarmops intermedium nimavirus]